MDLPTAALLEQLTGAQEGRHYRGSVFSEAPSLSHNKIPILGSFLLCLGRLWTSSCTDTCGHPFPNTLVLQGTAFSVCNGMGHIRGWEKRGANSRAGLFSFLFSVSVPWLQTQPWCCLSAPDSNRSSTGFLLCFGRLNLHSHCLCLSNLQVDIY